MNGNATIPLSVIDPDADGDAELEVTFDYTPGQEPSGMSGPPENYDPGAADEYECIIASVGGETRALSVDDEGKIIDWLDEQWFPPEPDYPEPDYRDE